jgi:glycosyltransferase involved in cell wall biosynthesis
VSVVIPTMLASSGLGRTVDSVIKSMSSASDRSEVILAVNGARPSQSAPRFDTPMVRVVELDRASAPAARNAGIAVAKHDAILFTDDDCAVPESWCTDMDRALNRDGHAAVAAPVRIAVEGPVTAFINHQRIFDAPAIDAEQVRYLVTANCGYRRDLAPQSFRFDDFNFNNAAEDADFGYRLRDAGARLHWLGSAEPTVHVLSASITEITDRFLRYGRGNARLYLRCGRWRESVPGGLDWYCDIAGGEYVEYRRFSEFTEPEVREAFALYDLLLTASFLIGYFEEVGAQLNYTLITAEHEQLKASIQRLTADSASTDGDIDWRNLHTDFTRLNAPRRLHNNEGLAVSALLREHVRPAVDLSPPVQNQLRAWREEFDQEISGVSNHLVRMWDDIDNSGPKLGMGLVESMLRSAGASFNDGCHDIEKMTYLRNAEQSQLSATNRSRITS